MYINVYMIIVSSPRYFSACASGPVVEEIIYRIYI